MRKAQRYKFLDIKDIHINTEQPRTHFEKEKLQELAVSISEVGLLQPIVVRPINKGYEIVVGERRFRACQLAGITEIPCIIEKMDDKQSQTAALVENIQREDLSAIEEALAYQSILDSQSITQKELAQKVGKTQSTIANKLRLLQLPISVQEAVKKRQITERHARALLQLDSTALINSLLKEIIHEHLTVEQTERKIKKLLSQHKPQLIHSVPRKVQVAINTLNQAMTMIEQTGVTIDKTIDETDEEMIMTIKIKK